MTSNESLTERCEFKQSEERHGDKRIGTCSLTTSVCYFSKIESSNCARRNIQVHGTLTRPYSQEELDELAKQHETRLQASQAGYEIWKREKDSRKGSLYS